MSAPSPQQDDGVLLSVPSVPASVARIRRFAVSAVADHGLDAFEDVVRLLVSEVATNALVHGTGDVVVRVLPVGAGVRVEVLDGSPQMPRPRAAGPDAEGGRGLGLVAMLAASWGAYREGAGKVVWFELDDRPAEHESEHDAEHRVGGQ